MKTFMPEFTTFSSNEIRPYASVSFLVQSTYQSKFLGRDVLVIRVLYYAVIFY